MSGDQMFNVIVAGGGTGGHLFPGIAVAEEFQKHADVDRIVFVGTEHGLEASVIPREGFDLEFVMAEGLVGKGLIGKIRAIFLILFAMIGSYRIIRKYNPEIIIGSGGYASFATVFTGLLLTIPTLILEQNAVPGLANRILAKFANIVCATYQESIHYFPKSKTYLTGNPVRERVLKGSRVSAIQLFGLDPDKFTILVFGGSHGATSINQAMVDALQYLLEIRSDVQFLHQTGEKDYEHVRNAYRNYGYSGLITPFIFQMAEAYAISEIVVSRAGATTIAELTAVGKPAILVPYPFAAGNHQEHNAKKLEQLGASFMILDRHMTGSNLAGKIKELYANERLRDEMHQNCISLGQPNAARKIFDMAFSLVSRKRTRNV